MRAGRLNTRVTFQKPGAGESENGYPDTENWNDFVSVWAEVSQTTGRERWANDHVAVVAPVNIRIRYRTDLDSTMRARNGSRYYQLKAEPLDPDGKRESMICICEEVKVDGEA